MVKVMKVIEVELYNRLMNLLKEKHQKPTSVPTKSVNYDDIFKNVIKNVRKKYKKKIKRKK
jgi:hypothetical protein